MPTFVTLAKWTDEGIRNIKDSPKRRQAFEDRITSMGGKVKDAYLVMGEYALVVVTEVPNDEPAAKMALGTAMQGNVHSWSLSPSFPLSVPAESHAVRLHRCRTPGFTSALSR